jgi:hypothetical protein
MKEINPLKIEDKDVVRAEQQQPKEVFIESIRMQKGHRLYEFNIKTRLIREAEFAEVNVQMGGFGRYKVRRKLLRKPDCVYLPALSPRDADIKGVEHLIKIGVIKKPQGELLLEAMKLQKKEAKVKASK